MLNIISLSLVFARGESAADSRRDISTKKATKISSFFVFAKIEEKLLSNHPS